MTVSERTVSVASSEFCGASVSPRQAKLSAAVAAVIDAQQRREEQQTAQAERTAESAAEALRAEFPEITVHTVAAQGGPADVIVRQADELNADVVVVGNKRVQGVARILGSVAGQIARDVNCDLFVAHTYLR